MPQFLSNSLEELRHGKIPAWIEFAIACRAKHRGREFWRTDIVVGGESEVLFRTAPGVAKIDPAQKGVSVPQPRLPPPTLSSLRRWTLGYRIIDYCRERASKFLASLPFGLGRKLLGQISPQVQRREGGFAEEGDGPTGNCPQELSCYQDPQDLLHPKPASVRSSSCIGSLDRVLTDFRSF